jgi:hypothetical protein
MRFKRKQDKKIVNKLRRTPEDNGRRVGTAPKIGLGFQAVYRSFAAGSINSRVKNGRKSADYFS